MATFAIVDDENNVLVDLLDGPLTLVPGTLRSAVADVAAGMRYVPFGAQLDFQHYRPQVTRFKVRGEDTAFVLAGYAERLAARFEAARRYHHDPSESESIWLQRSVEGEEPRRSLIFAGAIEQAPEGAITAQLDTGTYLAEVSILHHPFWEPTTAATASQVTAGTWIEERIELPDHNETTPGTLPARIAKLTLAATENDAGGKYRRVWLGIRPDYRGTGHDFKSAIFASWGAAHVDTTLYNPTGSSYTITTFTTTEGEAKRFSLTLGGGGNEGTIYVGRYLVLGLFNVSNADTVCGVRLKVGFEGGENFTPNEMAYVDGADFDYPLDPDYEYHVVDLGEIQIPPNGDYAGLTADELESLELQLFAERLEGTGNLEFGGFKLIPSDHYAHLRGVEFGVAADGSGLACFLATRPNDTHLASTNREDGGDGDTTVEFDVRNWYLPPGPSGLAVVVEMADGTLMDEAAFDYTFSYYPRYLSYRTDEAQ